MLVARIADMVEMNISFFEHRMPERENIVLQYSERYKGDKRLYMEMRVFALNVAIVDGQYLTAFRLASELTSELEDVTGLTSGTIVRLYSTIGTLISTHTAEAETITLDLSHLAAGMYLLNADGHTIRVIRK